MTTDQAATPTTPDTPDLRTDWFTLPGWTRAHALVQYSSMGAIPLYSTECEREYRVADPEVDEPTVAPADMPRCKSCAARRAERARQVPYRERAEQYIAIFIGAGDRWEFNIPVDAKRTKRGIRLGQIEIGPDTDQPGVWWLDDGVNPVRRYRKAVSR